MTNKTITQITNMKAQTIGCEVEMNKITRRKAAELAAEFFGTGRWENTNYRNGYQTWSAWDAQGREWQFKKDVSITGPDDEKCELVSPILVYGDIELLQGLIRVLRKAGAKSCASRGCGVHIHIGLKGLDGRNHNAHTLMNLVNIMAAHELQIGRAISIAQDRLNGYTKAVDPRFLRALNAKKPQTMEQLADIWYISQGYDHGRRDHYNPSRYHCLNLHASFTKGTVEFREFQFDEETDGKKGGLHAGQLKAYIQLCLAMSNQAKDVKYASPKAPQKENDKFAMRTWMNRMGCMGDEFKTARELLLKKLDGNCAWRFAS